MNKTEKKLADRIMVELKAVDEWLTVAEIARRCSPRPRGTFKLRVRRMVENMFQANKIQCEERSIKFGQKKMTVLFYRAKPWTTLQAKASGSTTPFMIALDELDDLRFQAANFGHSLDVPPRLPRRR